MVPVKIGNTYNFVLHIPAFIINNRAYSMNRTRSQKCGESIGRRSFRRDTSSAYIRNTINATYCSNTEKKKKKKKKQPRTPSFYAVGLKQCICSRGEMRGVYK